MSPVPISVRLPSSLREQLAATAEAEDRSFSALIVTLLDRGIVERAREQALVREMVSRLEETR